MPHLAEAHDFSAHRMRRLSLHFIYRSPQREAVSLSGAPLRIMSALLPTLVLLLLPSLAFAQKLRNLRGTVVDSTEAPLLSAQIAYRSAAGAIFATTDIAGNFSLEGAAEAGSLQVSFPGFAPVTLEIKPGIPAENLHIVLAPAPNLDRIQVKSSAEDRIPALPSSEYVISSQQMDISGSLVLDDVLRQAPGFSTYRRSSSLFANPSSQGISLRGVGASATSRTSVLLDGIPLNDPFGGWVYWGRVPRASVDSMEVSNGGASDVYGGGALGGVVNLRTHRRLEAFASAEISYGSMSTPDLSFAGGAPLGGWTIAGTVQAFREGGYILVPSEQRGLVDTNAGTSDLVGTFELGHSLGEQGRFFARASGFGESRRNGTPLQINDTTLPELDLGTDWLSSHAGRFSVRLYGSKELFHQTFSSITPDRHAESLTNVQTNPSQQIGFVGTWSRLIHEKHNVSAGVEIREVRGHSDETNYRLSAPSALVNAGGRQFSLGFFAQDAFLFAPNWVLTFGGRIDTWNNNSGYQNRTPLPSSTPTAAMFPDRSETAFSPRISLLRNFHNGLALSASVYQSFRAPYLNELYRNFRVGNVVTLANPALTAEHLTGGEAGYSLQRWQNRLTLRGDFFWSDIGNPVANVTLTSTPVLITRQKENLGSAQARGFELGGELRVEPRVQISAAYLFVNSTVISFAANPVLIGLFLPQVPQNQFSVQASYLGQGWNAGVQMRFLGNQFDDDLNQLPLGQAFSLDAQVSRQIAQHTSIFFAVQNLTNDRFMIARTPVVNVGPPVFVRGGFRFDFH